MEGLLVAQLIEERMGKHFNGPDALFAFDLEHLFEEVEEERTDLFPQVLGKRCAFDNRQHLCELLVMLEPF